MLSVVLCAIYGCAGSNLLCRAYSFICVTFISLLGEPPPSFVVGISASMFVDTHSVTCTCHSLTVSQRKEDGSQ